jgi:tripartite-type tricarboxylate transporter receptor subunit TctC
MKRMVCAGALVLLAGVNALVLAQQAASTEPVLSLSKGSGQAYPERPVRVVVNVTAGGGVDITARVVAQHFHAVFNQPFVIDNRVGAGGGIGIEIVAKSAPDAYTLLVASSGIVTNAAFRPVNYDPIRDFQPVSNLTSTPYLVVVTPSLPVASIKDLIALAKLKPGTVSYANSGLGSVTHLGATLLPTLSGTQMNGIPYKGVADAYPAVINGDVNWMLGAAISSLPLIKAGHLRALATTSSRRSRALPDLPTVAESGLPGYAVDGWFGMFAPAGTPMARVEKLGVEAKRGLQRPEFARRAEAQATEIVGSSPQEFSRVVRSEVELWRKVIRETGIKP